MEPVPSNTWELLRNDWAEWPTLLSMAIPALEQYHYRLLRIHQNSVFPGMSPLIRSDAIVMFEEMNDLPDTIGDGNKREGEGPSMRFIIDRTSSVAISIATMNTLP